MGLIHVLGGAIIMPVKLAKASTRTALVMTAFTVLGTLMLATTYLSTKDQVKKNELDAELALIDQILPRAAYDNDLLATPVELAASSELGTEEASVAHAAYLAGKRAGAVFEAIAPDGYSGRIKLLIAVQETPQGPAVAGVRVIAHRETPGLGDYIEPQKDKQEAKWIRLFDDQPASLAPEAWRVKKDGGQFAYRAGATITPRAVVKAVGKALAYYAARPDLFYPRH
jgi:electron transport complex protein RnfG